ncbi:MAG: 8-oxo-dGTP diphosphatase MutT [Burkholderiales bacterium PBB3]|nr:MAG: 8-oxo-dGTP diphosphatase MutT [Burkholderiales bacterium PBB3]
MTVPKVVDPQVVRAPQAERLLTEVAVGVLVRLSDGAFLLTSRPKGKPYAGYWEFPGGKLEAGETVLEALARELQEEIGIQVQDATLWRQEVFDYPHAMVRLHFCLVTNWLGNIEMRESQDFNWSTLPVRLEPVLPGTFPVLTWLAEDRGFIGPVSEGL